MFVGVKQMLNVAIKVGIGVSAVDACFLKHTQYGSGQLHIVSTKDGDNRLLPIAWCVCDTESGDSYQYFAEKCIEFGLAQYLNRDGSVIYSDRGKGVPTFCRAFPKAAALNCFFHLLKNVRKHCRENRASGTWADSAAWAMQRAETRSEYDAALDFLRQHCEMAADYLDRLDHAKTFRYAISQTHSCMGVKTNNIVEQVNGVWVNLRTEAPYRLNNGLLKWLGEKLFERQVASSIWMESVPPRRLTHYCKNLWGVQVAFAKNVAYKLTANGGDVFTVTGSSLTPGQPKVHKVNLNERTCCGDMFEMQQPCRHCVVVFNKYGQLDEDNIDETMAKFWPAWARADTYRDAYRGLTIHIPATYTGPFTGTSFFVLVFTTLFYNGLISTTQGMVAT